MQCELHCRAYFPVSQEMAGHFNGWINWRANAPFLPQVIQKTATEVVHTFRSTTITAYQLQTAGNKKEYEINRKTENQRRKQGTSLITTIRRGKTELWSRTIAWNGGWMSSNVTGEKVEAAQVNREQERTDERNLQQEMDRNHRFSGAPRASRWTVRMLLSGSIERSSLAWSRAVGWYNLVGHRRGTFRDLMIIAGLLVLEAH